MMAPAPSVYSDFYFVMNNKPTLSVDNLTFTELLKKFCALCGIRGFNTQCVQDPPLVRILRPGCATLHYATICLLSSILIISPYLHLAHLGFISGFCDYNLISLRVAYLSHAKSVLRATPISSP